MYDLKKKKQKKKFEIKKNNLMNFMMYIRLQFQIQSLTKMHKTISTKFQFKKFFIFT